MVGVADLTIFNEPVYDFTGAGERSVVEAEGIASAFLLFLPEPFFSFSSGLSAGIFSSRPGDLTRPVALGSDGLKNGCVDTGAVAVAVDTGTLGVENIFESTRP